MPFMLWLTLFGVFLIAPAGSAVAADHGLAMHGAPTLPKDFSHYPYANPRALQGGTLRQAQIGSFDSLNPFAIRGNAARNIRERVFESLLDRNHGEAFGLYGLLAETVTTSPDRRKVRFTLRKQAKFSDGVPITSADVAFSLNLLKTKGRPNHRYYYSKVTRVETPDAHTVIFRFANQPPDRELPLIMGLMPILPKHIYATRDIQSASLEIPIGSGPYVITEMTPGTRIRFQKSEKYWGARLALTTGRYNVATIIEDYFRDESIAFEAFKAGEIDLWFEHNPQRWLSGYRFPAARDGRIVKKTISLATPSGLKAFVLNTRRPIMSDMAVRRALDLLFDFNWVNKILYGGIYARTQSYFGNTDLSAANRPMSKKQTALLRASPVPQAILKAGYQAPESDGSGRDRRLRKAALIMLQEAGYQLSNQQLMTPKGQPVKLSLLVQRREDERLALAWRRMLGQIGIDLSVRLLDSSQYQRHLQTFDFDIIVYDYYASLSPGNEQAYYWGSEAAKTQGSRNYAGIQDAGIDTTVTALTQARSSQDFAEAARALDRALMTGGYFVPLFHNPVQWIAHWHHVKHPYRHTAYGAQPDSWWLDHGNETDQTITDKTMRRMKR